MQLRRNKASFIILRHKADNSVFNKYFTKHYLHINFISSRNLSQPDNVSNFTGFYWQINTDGSIDKILWLKNGLFTGAYRPSDGRSVATSRNCDADDSGPDCPSPAGGRRRNVLRVVLDGITNGIGNAATWVWGQVTTPCPSCSNGGGTGGFLDFGSNGDQGNVPNPSGTNSSSSPFNLNGEIDNTLFDMTGGSEKIRYYQEIYMSQLTFSDTDFEDLYYNRKLFTSVEVYFSAVGRSAVTAAAIKNNMSFVYTDADLLGYYLRLLAVNTVAYNNSLRMQFPASAISSFKKYVSAGFTKEEVNKIYSKPNLFLSLEYNLRGLSEAQQISLLTEYRDQVNWAEFDNVNYEVQIQDRNRDPGLNKSALDNNSYFVGLTN